MFPVTAGSVGCLDGQREIRGSFLGALRERGRGKKAFAKTIISPSPVTSFQVAEKLVDVLVLYWLNSWYFTANTDKNTK